MEANEIKALVAKAVAARLEGADALVDAPLWALARNFNGCGPAWLKEKWRAKLSRWSAAFMPAYLVHDWDYTASDGSREKFDEANERLERNCRRLADYEYGRLNWKRYAARAAAPLVYEACNLLGWIAWIDASR